MPRIETIETTAGEVETLLNRLGVDPQQRVTLLIEPDDWIAQARRESRRLVVAAGLSDEDIDRLIEEAREEVQPLLK